MTRAAQKIVIFFLFTTCYFLLATSTIHAQSRDPYSIPSTNSDVPQNLHTFTQSAIIEVISALTCQVAGIDAINPQQKCLGIDTKTGKIGYVEGGGGLIGLTSQGIAMLYIPPIHTSEYIAYLGNNFGIAKSANAQGVGAGFASLSPFLGLWTTFRNIVYLLFILFFVIIGVMIMLRIKIDQKAVMGVENQIPKIIIGIILVTFSFAIAGLLIDFMYVIIYLAISIISPKDIATLSLTSSPFGFVNSLFKTSTGGNQGLWVLIFHPAQMVGESVINGMKGLGGELTTGTATGVGLGAGALMGSASLIMWPLGVLMAFFTIPRLLCGIPFISGAVPDQVCFVANNAGSVTVGVIAGALAFLVIGAAILWALIRLWFALLNAYIFIIIDVVTAPFWIIAGIAPGSTFNFSAWIRDLMANLMAFPTAIILFLLGKRFMEDMGAIPGVAQFTPPLIGTPAAPLTLAPFVGLGVILLTPTVVQMMRDVFKAPPFKYTAAIGQAVGIGAGVPHRIIGGGLGYAFRPYYTKEGKLVDPTGPIGRALRSFGFFR